MEFLILGQLEVRNRRGVIAVGGAKPRAVLALLLLHPNEPVSAERVAVALWGEDAPPSRVKTVQVHVSRLRRALGEPGLVTTTAGGYQLRVLPGELDAARFEQLVEDGRQALAAGRCKEASSALGKALALWRGPPFADLAFEPFAEREAARLEEQRLVALELRVEADLAAGRHAELVVELKPIVAEHPRRESFAGQHMLALYRCGRQSEALDVYRKARERLVAEIGIEPGPDLRRLHAAILRQDSSLELEPARRELPPELDASAMPPLSGRSKELAWLGERWDEAQGGTGGVVTVAGASGSGKMRLAAQLAASVHDGGADVLYASGSGPADALLAAVRSVRRPARPTLLVIHAADRAGAETLAELDALVAEIEERDVLVVACGESLEALADLPADAVLVLEPLDVAAVLTIARQYARGAAADAVPADRLLEASGGMPGAVHQVASQWARREAARHVGAVAEKAAVGRAEWRSIQAELTGGVEELQDVRERVVTRRRDAPVICPFKGLASFDVVDAPYFFGREKLVAELVARLVGAQLLGIVGASGSGKSSVMRAGMLPALASGVLPGSDAWEQVLIRPGEHPLRELTGALAARGAGGGAGNGDRVVVAVDQFEETFTTCEDETERAAFIAELVRLTDDSHVVVIALRADFYGRCAAYPALASLLAANHVLVRSMQRDELRRAIELPAERVDLSVDADLTDALVADVKDEPGTLPLLSTSLLELWQTRDGRRLSYAAYQHTGGVRGAVARLAETAFGQLDEAQRDVARDVLMRLAGEGAAGGVERRRIALSELELDRGDDVAEVVALLTDRRLLTVSAGTIELAHEALMREWPRLRDWIEADREGLRIHRNLNAAAREWEELGRDEGELYRGARLAEAAEWSAARRPRLNEAERAFLEASEAARQRERVTRRRRVALAFGSLILALAAISIVALTLVSQNRATERQRDIAASRELAGRSVSLVESDPGLSRIIALAAYERSPTAQAKSAVRQATLADRAIAILDADAGGVAMATPSANGRLVATAGDDGKVKVWDPRRRRLASTISGHRGAARAAAFSPDATKVVTAGVDRVVAIADIDGTNRETLLTLPTDVQADGLDLGPGGRMLVVGASDGSVRLVDVVDRSTIDIGRHAMAVRRARFDRDGARVVSAGGDVRIWDVAKRKLLIQIDAGGAVYDAAFSPDGRRVASVGADGYLRIWDAASGRRAGTPLRVVAQDLLSVRYSPDGRELVTAAADGVVRVHDAAGTMLLSELKGSLGVVSDAAFAAGGTIVSAGEEGALRVWSPVRTARLRGNADTSPSFSADRRHVVWADTRGYVHRWDVVTGRDLSLADTGEHEATPTVVQESADGSRIVRASDDGAVWVYDVKGGRSRQVRSGVDVPYAVTIDRTGRRVAVAGEGSEVRIAPVEGGRAVVAGRGGEYEVYSVAFSPDGRHVVSAATDGVGRIYEADTGRLVRPLRGHTDTITFVAYNADGDRIVTAGADTTIRVWPAAGGKPAVLFGHRTAVNSVAFDRDGERLVSASEDGEVRVWDVASGDSMVVLERYATARGAGFSPDGARVVSQGGPPRRGELRATPCEVCGEFDDVLRLAKSRANRALSAADRQRLLGDTP